jgi:hypothetical protein
MTGTVTVARLESRRRGRHHLASIVMAASGADMMRTLHLATIRAFDVARRLQMMMGATHVAARLRGLLFRYCHGCHSGMAPDSGARCRSIAKKAGGGKLLGWAAIGAIYGFGENAPSFSPPCAINAPVAPLPARQSGGRCHPPLGGSGPGLPLISCRQPNHGGIASKEAPSHGKGARG